LIWTLPCIYNGPRGEGDGRVEEGGESARVGIVSPLKKFVADAWGVMGKQSRSWSARGTEPQPHDGL